MSSPSQSITKSIKIKNYYFGFGYQDAQIYIIVSKFNDHIKHSCESVTFCNLCECDGDSRCVSARRIHGCNGISVFFKENEEYFELVELEKESFILETC
jgi:hypothetical protein